jgi:hypothetical protein
VEPHVTLMSPGWLQQNAEVVQAREGTGDLEGKARVICSDFRSRTAQLYVLLQSNTVQAPQRVPHLRQLLLRLNFNQFMEREAAAHAKVAEALAVEKPDVLVIAH